LNILTPTSRVAALSIFQKVWTADTFQDERVKTTLEIRFFAL
jgi:hypothetical protein